MARAMPVVLILALLLATTTGVAQQLLPALGTIDGATAGSVDSTEFVLDAAPDRVDAIATRHNLTILRSLDEHGHGIVLVRGPGTKTPEELIADLEADADVSHFELNGLAISPEVPSGIQLDQSPVYILDTLSGARTLVDYFGKQTWSAYINQPAATVIRLADAQRAYATGASIVAIIDTGIDPDHALLKDSLVPGYDFVNDAAGQASEWTDLDPTTAATLNQSPVYILDQSPVYILDESAKVVPLNQSTVAVLSDAIARQLDPAALPPAFGHGTMVAGLVHLVAPTAKIMPLKAFKADGSSRVFDIVRAIYYAVEHGARVINMSFSTAKLSPEIIHAINFATDRGVICVSSAGNSGKELLVYPAALRNVLGIGSTTSTTLPARSTFSNYGDALVRLAAPGEGVITTYPGNLYVGAWGTSFSTPLVAGAAALLLQKNPAIDYAIASDYLGKADRTGNIGMGRGRLNLYEAVQQLPDGTAPTIALVTPTSGSVVRNTIVVTASASDNIGVSSVMFLVNNQRIGNDDTTAPFEVTWDTTTVPNGSYTLAAVAKDAYGNATSTSISVTVANDAQAPSVAITSPASAAQVSFREQVPDGASGRKTAWLATLRTRQTT
jgi:subtilisin family serine protease